MFFAGFSQKRIHIDNSYRSIPAVTNFFPRLACDEFLAIEGIEKET